MRRSARWAVFGLLITIWLLRSPPPSAHAQDDEPEGYRALIEQALSEYEAKNYEEAGSLFARAHALAPSARTFRGLGMASFELRRYPESVDQLERALASNIKPLDAALRAETQTLLSRARGFIASVTVELRPAQATLLVDGNEVDDRRLRLPLGDHEFEARLAGHRAEKRRLRVRGGEVSQLQLVLSPEPSEGVAGDDTRGARKRPWLWVGVSAAAAVAVGAVVAGVVIATRDRERTELIASGTQNTPEGAFLSLGGRGR